jgi:hypothetical protein
MLKILGPVLRCATITFCISGVFSAQECHYVHPPLSPPDESAFPQPPSSDKIKFVGPIIRQVGVTCWYAEPDAPAKCVGGVHGFQKIVSFVPTEPTVRSASVDTSFRQKSLSSFSAGGATSELKSEDIPPGIFVSFKGHPVFKVTKVQFPAKSVELVRLQEGLTTGVSVELDFSHEPSNGECYLYVAVWVAVK